jgi:CheY-like chemotaxis protein
MFATRLDGKKILVVDDFEVNTTMLQLFLQEDGALVDITTNGRKCVEMIKENCYDLLFMDVYMPVMGGIEATRIIRTLENGTDLPIVMITGEEDSEMVKICEDAGANDVVRKPFNPEEIINTCLKWLGKIDNTALEECVFNSKGSVETTMDQSVVFDSKRALAEFENDKELLDAVVLKFVNSLNDQLEQLRHAIVQLNWEQLFVISHTIKGAAANLCAAALSTSAKNFEAIAKKKSAAETESAFHSLKKEIDNFVEYYNSIK